MTRLAGSFAVASVLAAATASAHADPSASLDRRPVLDGPADAGTDDAWKHDAIPPLRRSGTAGLGMQLGAARIANTGHLRLAYRVYGPLFVGALFQGTLSTSGLDGCTFDCNRRLLDAHLVTEAHAFADSPFDLWAGVEIGPSFVQRDQSGAGPSPVLFALQGNVGVDLRLATGEVRPLVGVAIGLGGYLGDKEVNGWTGSAGWHAGLEF